VRPLTLILLAACSPDRLPDPPVTVDSSAPGVDSQGGADSQGVADSRTGGADSRDSAPAADSVATDSAAGGSWRPRQLLVVMVDTLRRDAQGYMGGACGATPRMDALAAGGAVVEQVITPRGLTRPTVATWLSGLHPRDHGIWSHGNLVPGEHRLWMDRTAAQEVALFATNACPVYEGVVSADPHLCLVEEQGVDLAPTNDAEAVAAAAAWLDEARERSFVGLVHLLSPHAPYTAHEPWFSALLAACPDYTAWDIEDGFSAIAADGVDELERAWLSRNYEAGAALDDALLGELVDQLTAQGFFEDGLLVVGADHGEELFSHPEYLYDGHADAPWLSVTATSWIFYAPGRVAPQRRPEMVCMTDVGATFFDLVGAEADVPDGGSFWPALLAGEAPAPRTCFGEITPDVGVVLEDGWHLVANPGEVTFTSLVIDADRELRLPRKLLYELGADPDEQRDVSSEQDERVQALWRSLCDYVQAREYAQEGAPNFITASCEATRPL